MKKLTEKDAASESLDAVDDSHVVSKVIIIAAPRVVAKNALHEFRSFSTILRDVGCYYVLEQSIA